jgi:hypothetical protein
MDSSPVENGGGDAGRVPPDLVPALKVDDIVGAAFADPSILSDRTDEELRQLWWQAEMLQFVSLRLRAAIAAELRKRYDHYGGKWAIKAAKIMNTHSRQIYYAVHIWDAFRTRVADLERIGIRLAMACASTPDPDAAIDYAIKEREKGLPVTSVQLGIMRHFPGRGPRHAFRYGPPLDSRYIRHEPIDEQGVVFLFGVLAAELGFLVEAVRQRFPDCRAKRNVGGVYFDVTIEFEFRSSDFARHGHPVGDCDLIVCWEDDWSDCPIEVLELKSALQELAELARRQ